MTSPRQSHIAELRQHLREMLRLEENLEIDRIQFVNSHDFSLLQLFQIFTANPTDRLTERQLHIKLNALGYI